MPNKNKVEMIDVVQLRFQVPSIAKKWILTSISQKWRNWKNTLKARYWTNSPVELMIHKRDKRVLLEQWINILTQWNTEEAKQESLKNKDARSKRIMNPRTGKQSFAEVRAKMTKAKGRIPTRVELFSSCYIDDDGNACEVALSKYSAMQERSNQLPEGSEDPIGPNDVFAQVMGQDRPSYTRMLGKGVCPSDVWGEVPQNTSNYLLMEHQSRAIHLESDDQPRQRSGTSQGDFGHNTSTLNSLSRHVMTTQPLAVGAYVDVKSLLEPTKTIAKGCICSTNPSTEVGGQILGSDWCEINVKVLVQPEERLIRLYDNIQKIADTLGGMIAWPCRWVTLSED